MTKHRLPIEDRLNLWVEPDLNGGCSLWSGTQTADGYGALHVGAKTVRVHRLVWQLTFGPIPRGMCVCHRCDTPACVNPGHLFLGTQRENMQDAKSKGRSRAPPVRRGSEHPAARLLESDVQEILRGLGEGIGHAALAARFSVSNSLISQISRGQIWAHVPGSGTRFQRKRPKARTHCRRGHEFTPETTRQEGAGRRCLICRGITQGRAAQETEK